jgi:manganese transport protein
MAAGSIYSGIYKESYDIKDSHSKTGVVISLLGALLIIFFIGDPFKGLIYSQMILSIQLPFTIFFQLYLTSSAKVMGKHRNPIRTNLLIGLFGAIVTVLNIALFVNLLKSPI